jgi:tRNA1Val (adenine37-N6)-methyltransferase
MPGVNNPLLHKDETLDNLELGNLKIIQPKAGYRFNIDSVLLAFFADLSNTKKVVDLGTGSGIIPLILSYRSETVKITGIELSASAVQRARRSVRYNELDDRITIIEGDIKHLDKKIAPLSTDMVISNPPYWKKGEGRVPENPEKAIARHELEINLEQIISAANYLLPAGGKLYIAQRAERLEEALLYFDKYNFKQTNIKLVQAFKDRAAHSALIESSKDSRKEVFYLPPLVIYNNDGTYTEEVLKIYNA